MTEAHEVASSRLKSVVLATGGPFDKMVSNSAVRSSTYTLPMRTRALGRQTRSTRRKRLALQQIGPVTRLLELTYRRGSRAATRNLNGCVASRLLQCHIFLSVLLTLLQVALGGGRSNDPAEELMSNPNLHADVFCLHLNSHVKIEQLIEVQSLLDERSSD